MRSRFTPQARGAVLQGLYAGLTLSEAAAQADLGAQLVRNWTTRGRSEAGTDYAVFAEAVDRARDAAAAAPMCEGEFVGCLNRSVRSGSVSAMKLWWTIRVQRADREPGSDLDDAFADLDDDYQGDGLTRLRQRRLSRLDRLDMHTDQGDEDHAA